MKSKYNHIQVYNVWVNGRDIEDVDQHFPINSNVDRKWHSDFKKASQDYLSAKAENECEQGFNDEIFQDYQVILFSIDIDIDKFQDMFDLDFDLENDDVLEMIPYYCDYDFNVVAERIEKFEGFYA